jgi:hypothetical protein
MGADHPAEDHLMQLLKYQGAALFPDAQPGDMVGWQSLTWTVTDQGHLSATTADTALAVDLIRNGGVAEVIADGEQSIAAPLIEAARASEIAEADAAQGEG